MSPRPHTPRPLAVIRDQEPTQDQIASGIARLIQDYEDRGRTPARQLLSSLARESFALLSALCQAEERGLNGERLKKIRDSWTVLADPATGVPMLLSGDIEQQLAAFREDFND